VDNDGSPLVQMCPLNETKPVYCSDCPDLFIRISQLQCNVSLPLIERPQDLLQSLHGRLHIKWGLASIYFFAALTKRFKTVSVGQEGLYYLNSCQCCDKMSLVANSALLIPSHIQLQIYLHRRRSGVLELHLWGFPQCVVGALNWKT
jgi:hypothetical protein